MLILTRRSDETICVGDEVKITVLGIKGSQVRIGVDAPREVPVHREEIYQRIQAAADAAETCQKTTPGMPESSSEEVVDSQ